MPPLRYRACRHLYGSAYFSYVRIFAHMYLRLLPYPLAQKLRDVITVKQQRRSKRLQIGGKVVGSYSLLAPGTTLYWRSDPAVVRLCEQHRSEAFRNQVMFL